MKKFKEFKIDDQAVIGAKVFGFAEYLIKKNDPSKKLSNRHLQRVTDWLWTNNIEINPKTKMIEFNQATDMLKACFNQ